MSDRWSVAGEAYDAFMGRWSAVLCLEFVDWLAPEPGGSWLDVGCGTGSLVAAIRARAAPSSVTGCDPSESFVAAARDAHQAPDVSFVVAGAGDLPERPGGYDHVSSALVLNFLPDPSAGAAEMRELTAPGGSVSACVWDYSDGMTFLRAFWDEAVTLDPAARELDEGVRFPVCHPEALEEVFVGAGLADVRTAAIEIPTRFASFEEYWAPFVGGPGPAPGYAGSLDEERRTALRDRLEQRLAPNGGPIDITARAWAVRGAVG